MVDNVIKGAWIFKDGRLQKDQNCLKIEDMLKTELREVADKDGGWTKLYEDKVGAYWELTYPESEAHGGGAPQLAKLEINSVQDWRAN